MRKILNLPMKNNDVVVGSGGTVAPVSPAAPPAPVDPGHSSSDSSLDSLRDILGIGTFKGTDVGGAKPASPIVRAEPAAAPAVSPPPPPPPPRPDPNIIALTQAVRDLAARPAEQAQPPVEDTGPFSEAIPPAFMDALESEDKAVRTRAVQNLWNSAMNNAVLYMKEFLAEQVVPALRQGWNNDVQGAIEANATLSRFYGKWKNLDNAIGRKLSTDVSVVLLKRYAAANQQVDPRSNEFLDEVGLATTNLLRTTSGLPAITLEDLKAPSSNVAGNGVHSGNGHPRNDPAFIAKPGARPAPTDPKTQDDLSHYEF